MSKAIARSIAFPPALLKRVDRFAKRLGISRSEFVRRALEDHFERASELAALEDPIVLRAFANALSEPGVLRGMASAMKSQVPEEQLAPLFALIAEGAGKEASGGVAKKKAARGGKPRRPNARKA